MSFVKFFKDITDDDIGLVGGKALSLGKMTRAGIPVPAGYVITTDLFKVYQTAGVIDKSVQDALYEAFDALGAARVAVRSSAIAEDSSTASWAGQFESYLNVERGELLDRVVDCWKSTSDGYEYAAAQNISHDLLAMGVVIQQMVDSEVAGVAFSVNPISHAADEIMIEATYGLGELLVQGMVTPDNYVVSKAGGTILGSHVVKKPTMLVYQDGRNAKVAVLTDKQEQSCLTEDELRQLTEIIRAIEDFYGSPQDIEWALANNEFYIVQSRPITA